MLDFHLKISKMADDDDDDEGTSPERIFIDKKFLALNKAIALTQLAAIYALILSKDSKGFEVKESDLYWDCWRRIHYLHMILSKRIKDSKKIKSERKKELKVFVDNYKDKNVTLEDLGNAVNLVIEFGCLFGLMDDKLAEESQGDETPGYF